MDITCVILLTILLILIFSSRDPERHHADWRIKTFCVLFLVSVALNIKYHQTVHLYTVLICGTLRNKWLCFIYDVHCKHNTQDWRPILTLTLPQTDCVMVNAWCQNISDNVNICGKSLQQPLQLLVPVVVAVMVPRAPTLPFLTDFSMTDFSMTGWFQYDWFVITACL